MTQLSNHYLYPSALLVSTEPCIISTLLGSCVSVCLWDSRLQIGGMNHYLLPLWNGEGLPSPKYGNIAIHKLLDSLLEKGSAIQNIQAQVFGGADVLNMQKNHFNIGARNIKQAHEMLTEIGIPVTAESTGGSRGRKILFYPHKGEIRLKYLEKNS
mgnify:CR=1 FL=1